MDIRKEHINHVFARKYSLQDQKELEKYFQDKKLNEQTRKVIRNQWEQFREEPDNKPDIDQLYYKLFYTIHQNDSATSGKSLFWQILKIAAVLLVGVFIASGIYFFSGDDRNGCILPLEFVSQTGFRNQFKLPDGTTGWLGSGSDLKYYVDKNKQRVVELDGIAYFDVTHQKSQNFIVKTPSNLDVQVLGTKFNVTSYSSEHSCEIVLEQGSVELDLKNRKISSMVPNERVVYCQENNSIQKTKVDVADYLAWKDGKLILNDLSLEESCVRLSRFYNVEFEVQKGVTNNQKVRLVLEDESLNEALTLLSMILPVTCKVEERSLLKDNMYSKKKVIIKNK